MRTLSCLLSLFLLPALAAPAPAQFSATLGLNTTETQEIEVLLKAGNATRALKKTREQIELIRARMETEVTSGENLARIVALEAVALALKGKEDDALWQWSVAQNLDRGVARRRYAKDYGAAGALLDRHRLRSPGEAPEGTDARSAESWLRLAGLNEVTLPEATKMAAWEPYTKPGVGLRHAELRTVAVEVMVDVAGKPHAPVVLSGGDRPGLVYSAVRTIRRWQFRPGTVDGEPREMLFTATLSVDPRKI
jgi:hypothetical protein